MMIGGVQFAPSVANPLVQRYSAEGMMAAEKSKRNCLVAEAMLVTGEKKLEKLPEPSAGAYRTPFAISHSSEADECASDSCKKKIATLKREVQALLNKISPENRSSLLPQLLKLGVRSAKGLSMICTMMVEKALGDAFYSALYADCIQSLCWEHDTIPRLNGSACTCSDRDCGSNPRGNSLLELDLDQMEKDCESFEVMVLHSCHLMFRSFFLTPEILDNETEDVAKSLGDDEMSAVDIRRQRAKACMRLFGHLCLRSILPDSTLLSYLQELLEPPRGSSARWPPKAWIECACELLVTVSKSLEGTVSGSRILAPAIAKLRRLMHLKIQDSHVFPSRIRFMIQDILDARQHG